MSWGKMTTTKDFVKSLHRRNEITTQEQITTTMLTEANAAVYCNTMYVSGIGANEDEILKFNVVSD